MAQTAGVPLCKVNPRYLHSNSTSHTWAFSAIAELIDNAYDPDVKATHVDIDTMRINDEHCLIIQDNGAGIETANLLKMLSFGFCDKDAITDSYAPIGYYGNGFKSGSMRLGKNALVFTRCKNSTSVGFLSQTYLQAIEAETILVPILEYNKTNYIRCKDDSETQNCLEAILKYSVFHTETELKAQLKTLESSVTGTKIIIFHLNTSQDGMLELDLVSDPTDIRCPETITYDIAMTARPVVQKPSDYRRSLRVYTSILYLIPRMKIILRGKPVRSKLVSRSLSKTERDTYRPTWLRMPIKIIFGFNCDMLDDYGMMLYHKNRLIKAYEKVGYQKQENELGVGVVGVAEVDFFEPIHNKQDFKTDEKYNSVMKAFGDKLNDYWNEKIHGQKSQIPHKGREVPDLWAQCDTCLKWRRLPGVSTKKSLPGKWFCFLNRDATHNRCDIPEETEGDDEEVLKPSYKKTFKQKRKEERQKEKKICEDILRQASESTVQNSKAHSLRLQRSSLKPSPEQTATPTTTTENQPADTSHMDDSDDDFQSTPSKKPHLDQNIKHSKYEANSLQLAPSFLKKKPHKIRNTEEDVTSPTSSNQQDNYNTESYEQDEAQEVSATNDHKSESKRGIGSLNGTETSPVGPSQIKKISSSNDVPMEEHPSLTYPLARNDLTTRNKETDESVEGQRTTQKVEVKKDKGDVRVKLEMADETALTSCQSKSPRSGSQLLEMMRKKLKLREKDLEDIEERFRKFRSNVQNLLAFMAPDLDVKEVNDIEILVENLIKKYQERAKEEGDLEEDYKVDKPVIDLKQPMVEFQGSNSSLNKTKSKANEKQCCIS